jgi:hypothetical protein
MDAAYSSERLVTTYTIEDVTTQKTTMRILTVVKTSNLIKAKALVLFPGLV